MKKTIKYAEEIASIFILIDLVIIFSFFFILPFNDWSFNKDAELFSQYGNFIGGLVGSLFSLAAFLLIYKTLMTQQASFTQQESIFRQQKKIFEQQIFETTFFNLINNQNNIINNLKSYFYSLNDLSTILTHTVIGRDFFIYSKRELLDIWNSLNSSSFSGYYDDIEVLDIQNQIKELYDPGSPDFKEQDDARDIEKGLEYKIRLSQVNKYYRITKNYWESSKDKEIIGKINLMYGLYFQRYEYVAGHYFRHLYHLLDYVEQTENKLMELSDNQDEKTEIQKNYRKYASIVQAQMSSLELMLLFYNSLSFPKMLRLIKKYNFLENLAFENLLDQSHNCIVEINLKSKRDLI